jgi:hypothetical protein
MGMLFEPTLLKVLIAQLLELSAREHKRTLYNACGEAALKQENVNAKIRLTVYDLVITRNEEKRGGRVYQLN